MDEIAAWLAAALLYICLIVVALRAIAALHVAKCNECQEIRKSPVHGVPRDYCDFAYRHLAFACFVWPIGLPALCLVRLKRGGFISAAEGKSYAASPSSSREGSSAAPEISATITAS